MGLEYSEKLIREFPGASVFLNVPLKRLCTFRTGGLGDAVVYPRSVNELKDIVEFVKREKVEYYVLGNGSNVLFSDSGYTGVLIRTDRLNSIAFSRGILRAEAGAKLCRLACFCLDKQIGGYEFCHGIPATVGGAAAMNAGAFKREFKDVALKIETEDGCLNAEECGFGYRDSIFLHEKLTVLSVEFKADGGDKEDIKAKMERFRKIRVESQPQGAACAGSVFKRAGGKEVWRYVDELGFRGYSLGGAAVSEKHANFIINTGNATSSQIYGLIKLIKKRALEQLGLTLEEELRYIGTFDDIDG